MSFLQRAAELGQASTFISEEGQESFIKSASESDVTVNDMYMAYNLMSNDVDLYTKEGFIENDDNVEPSRLSSAIDLMVKQASADPLSDEDAMEFLTEIGLEANDYNEVYDYVGADLIQKVANEVDGVESELTADDAVWDKVAEAHDYLVGAGLDPVEALNFAADFNEAETVEDQDKVASEIEDLEQGEIDKIAEAVNHLSDIEGIHPADLMVEWDKVAGKKTEAVKKTLRLAKGKLKNYAGNLTGGRVNKLEKSIARESDAALKGKRSGSVDQLLKGNKQRDFKKGSGLDALKSARNTARAATAGGVTAAGAGTAGYALANKED